MGLLFILTAALCWTALNGPSHAIEMDLCKERSCYPATGNLLIGRENRLTATSTCGMTRSSRFCIVSHLEDKKKCFICNSQQPFSEYREPNRFSHRIENIVTERYQMRKKKWWQSVNGVQNVSIRLDLEAEFHFTHLVITFKTFRPAAMVIEKSGDFGKTWRTYRYFSYDCADEFPGITATRTPQSHDDVICTDRYSDVSPSTGGEVVFKVLSPHIELKDPYAENIQELLKITNLRINFTKLHTLGDDLLDRRNEIIEKYYYAIYDMVVRGSCSCYGHASRCIPIQSADAVGHVNQRPDMVHGQCECTHHTKGLNCEECEDFYNDLPWRPAIAKATNACQRCQCNRHASRCHFDRAVYEASGFVSGGVCDECQHNTMGKNCEECKAYFYRVPGTTIDDPYVCRECVCDLRGAMNEGICDSKNDEEKGLVAGRCHCKSNVAGDRCDRCKDGFYELSEEDPAGCKQCTCYLMGTVNNEGCDKRSGDCNCKRLVTGPNCDMCLPNHYGLDDDADGCKACNCDLGGSKSEECDFKDGQCECLPHYSGRRCDQPESGYFCPNIDFYTYEAESTELPPGVTVDRREGGVDLFSRGWTGEGFARIRQGDTLSFVVDDLQSSMDYHIVVRYESDRESGWRTVDLVVVRPDNPSSADSPCFNSIPKDDFTQIQLTPGGKYSEVHPAVCLEAGAKYEIRLTMGETRGGQPGSAMLIDSIVLAPPTEKLDIFASGALAEYHRNEYDRNQCRHEALSLTPMDRVSAACKRYTCPIAAVIVKKGIECDCDVTGSKSGICSPLGGQCECKANVVGRKCDACAAGHYGFGPQGCLACQCDSVGALDNHCDIRTGQCKCREAGVYGRQCNQCQPGFWGFPDCRKCQCNEHADICDQKSGACIECRDLTAGHRCDRCQDGYYGDPRLGVSIACRACPCPGGPASGKQHAATCYLRGGDVACNCEMGYEGERCDECIMNYWGDPTEVGGSCNKCECNGNIDVGVEGSCDKKSGDCLKCLYNTEGQFCENCLEGFYGDAKIRSCQRCVCNQLGTNSSASACDRVSGQCVCLPNVEGVQCDTCAENHWNLASSEGCGACDCDEIGVVEDRDGNKHMQCNEFDGQCRCRPDRGGRRCADCQDYHWGDPAIECKRCECNPSGSSTLQCHRNNGTCVCNPGSGGALCDECARGYTGQWPYCEPCGECFQNWDRILQQLKAETETLIGQANNIEDTGVSSVYDEDFQEMEDTLDDLKTQLDTANITADDVEKLRKEIDMLKNKTAEAKERLHEVDNRVTEKAASVDQAEQGLKGLQGEADKLQSLTDQLKENATKLREADVEGAFNITRESARRSSEAKVRAEAADGSVATSEQARRTAEELLASSKDEFDKQFQENQAALEMVGGKIVELEAGLPPLNKDVCGAPGDPCDELCGGAGCPNGCGGSSCKDGSVEKAKNALNFARDAADELAVKQKEAEDLITRVRESLRAAELAKNAANEAHNAAKGVADSANQTKVDLQEMLDKVEKFFSESRATPEMIRTLAEEVFNMSIPLNSTQIDVMSAEITETLSKLSNIDAILDETRGNLTNAQQLKERADLAKMKAELILNTTQQVQDALDAAKTAQDNARTAIGDAQDDIDTAREDIDTISEVTAEVEATAERSNATVRQLMDNAKSLHEQWVGISTDTGNAQKNADQAINVGNAARDKAAMLTKLYAEAETELESKQGINDKKRAEELRENAAKMLERTQKHLTDIQQQRQNYDANEAGLDAYAKTLDGLHKQIDECTADIQEKLTFYDSCDTAPQ